MSSIPKADLELRYRSFSAESFEDLDRSIKAWIVETGAVITSVSYGYDGYTYMQRAMISFINKGL